MCNPMAVALLAAGAGSQAYGQHQAAKAMDSALENGMRRQGEMQGQINNTVLTGADRDFSADNVAQNYEQAAKERGDSLMSILQEHASPDAAEPVGRERQSGAFIQARAEAQAKQMAAAAKLAALMGRAGAQGDMSQRRQSRQLNDADHIVGIGQDMRAGQQQTQWDMQKAAHKGDNAQLLGGLLMLAGTMGAGSAAAPVAATPMKKLINTPQGMFGALA